MHWEYLTVDSHRDVHASALEVTNWTPYIPDTLEKLGAERWELVHVIAHVSHVGRAGGAITTDERWIFKRPKQP